MVLGSRDTWLAARSTISLINISAFDVGSALEIARKVAETLQFLHDQNQVHLDIKPENVLFRRPIEPGSSVEPVLIDFGVSRTIGQEELEAHTALCSA